MIPRGAASDPLAISLHEVEERYGALAAARRAAETVLAGKDEVITPESWIATATANIEAQANLRRAAFMPLGLLDRLYHDSLLIQEFVFQASEHAGLERALLGVAINSGAPLVGERLRLLEYHRILGQLQVLKRLQAGKGDERTMKSIGAIERGGKRLAAMIADLVESTRIESGQLEMHKGPTSLPELIRALFDTMSLPERQRIRLEVEGEVPEVNADPERLERVLANLLGNALKYSPQGSEVVICVERRGDELVTSVTDEGQGIPAEDLPRLFQRFSRVGGAKEKATGLGLGLYIAQQLVGAHGGRIWVESEVDKGSIFHFSLPLR